MARATWFNEHVFETQVSLHDLGGFKMGWFPPSDVKGSVSGALVPYEQYIPSITAGALVYFSRNDVQEPLDRVVTAKGAIIYGKTEIGDGHGFMGIIKDIQQDWVAR